MNVVPGDAVVLAGGDAPAHREHQSLGPGDVDAVQSHLPLLGVGKESLAGEVAGSELVPG